MKGVPKTRLYRAMRKGEIRVNKGRAKADYRVEAGDQVRIPPIRMSDSTPLTKVPGRWQNLVTKHCIYQDTGLMVINKPSGLAVHGGSGMSAGLIECLRLLLPDNRYIELVHRIDRDTSGCLLIALKSSVLKDLHRQLRENTVDKTYLALVEGQWPRNRSYVDAPLKKNDLKSGERVVRVDKNGKQARTNFRVIERFADCTLIEAKPVTGRTHQIRVHALHAGHPLLGDEKYCGRERLKADRSLGLQRLFLHAQSLRFTDLEGGVQEVRAELDSELEQHLDRLRK
jgi:23S rRNA pseudouridine955/2504/2580 synthase